MTRLDLEKNLKVWMTPAITAEQGKKRGVTASVPLYKITME